MPPPLERRAHNLQERVFQFYRCGTEAHAGKTNTHWYGGGTPAACRRAVEYCDGWMPARTTLATFRKLKSYLRELCAKAAKPMIGAAVMPFTSVARDRQDALSRINFEVLIAEANKFPTWVKPPGGVFDTPDDIRGLILAGTPAESSGEPRLRNGWCRPHRLRFTVSLRRLVRANRAAGSRSSLALRACGSRFF